MAPAVVNAIWIGPELGEIQAACLRSFLRHGHTVVLHCYTEPHDCPRGVELADANKLLPEARIVRSKKNGSYSVFSDLLRIEILRQGLGLYVDCDMYCLKPIEDEDYIFGMNHGYLLNAVLKVPLGCPLLGDLQPILDGNFIPPWVGLRAQITMRLRRALAMELPNCADLPVGWVGSKAFEHYAKKRGVLHLAKPTETFFSLHKRNVEHLFDPNRKLEEFVSPSAVAIHLWNDRRTQKGFSELAIPPNSPLGRLLAV